MRLVELAERVIQEQRSHHDEADNGDDDAEGRRHHSLDQEGQLGIPAGGADQAHDANLGAAGIGGDLNHIGDQQNRPDRLHQRDSESSVAEAVQHGEEVIDQILLIEQMINPGLTLHRGVKLVVLLGILQLDDE